MFKRSLLAATASAIMALVTIMAFPAAAQSDDDITQSVAASRDSAVSSVRLTAAGVKLVAGIAFAPVRRTLRDSERVGEAIGESSRMAGDSANGHLEVSPETIQAQPAPKVPYDVQPDHPADADRTSNGGGQ